MKLIDSVDLKRIESHNQDHRNKNGQKINFIDVFHRDHRPYV
jgi:hypothetical protein